MLVQGSVASHFNSTHNLTLSGLVSLQKIDFDQYLIHNVLLISSIVRAAESAELAARHFSSRLHSISLAAFGSLETGRITQHSFFVYLCIEQHNNAVP